MRQHAIKLSKKEKRALDIVRAHQFGREDEPYGNIVRILFNTYKEQHKFGEDI